MSERLELLSDKIRKGIPVELSEAIEVIDYQERLKQEKQKILQWYNTGFFPCSNGWSRCWWKNLIWRIFRYEFN